MTTTGTDTGIDKAYKNVRFVKGLVGCALALATFAGLASQNNQQSQQPASVTDMTAISRGQVIQVVETSYGYQYKVRYTDEDSKGHTVMASGTDDMQTYQMADFVEVRYDPTNPDGGCDIVRSVYSVADVVEQNVAPEDVGGTGDATAGTTGSGAGSSDSPSSSSGSGSRKTMADRLLEEGGIDPDGGDGEDTLSKVLSPDSE